jgi:hypothetical protein
MKPWFWSGWILFAAIVMMLIGAFDVLQGIAAIFSDGFYGVTEDELVVLDFTAWGWVTLIWGVVLLVCGFGVITGREWARWVGLVIVGLSVVGHAFFLAASPAWSVIVIGLCVLIAFALAARWAEAQADMSGQA